MYVLARLIFDQLNCDYGLLADTSVVSFLLTNSVVIIFRNMQVFLNVLCINARLNAIPVIVGLPLKFDVSLTIVN